MDYSEKLNSINWKTKRQEILLRDNYKCLRCGISKTNNFHGKIFSLGTNIEDKFKINFFEDKNLNTTLVSIKSNDETEYTCKSNIDNSKIKKNQEYVITVNYAEKKIIKYPFNGSTIDNLKDNLFLNKSTNQFLISNITNNDIKGANIEVDIEAFWLIEYGIENLSCKDGNKLHVHHKCYRKGVEIWDQDDDEYLTLCSICHEIVHNNQLIPFYDEYGRIIQFMNPCSKCNGTGYLDHFKHISNGICFNCHGQGSITDLTSYY